MEYNWRLGEIVNLPKITEHVGSHQIRSYEHFIRSHYICIREATSKQQGILFKILGKTMRKDILIKGGEPFCKDEKVEAFESDIYYSFRFPSSEELKTALDIIQDNPMLLGKLELSDKHISLRSTFWVRDITSKLLFFKDPLYFDGRSNKICPPTSSKDVHFRITLAYFTDSKINW